MPLSRRFAFAALLALTPLPALAQPADASLAVWLGEGIPGARLAASIRVLAASPPPGVAGLEGGAEVYAAMVYESFPVDAVVAEIADTLERTVDEETLEVVQRFDASIFGVRITARVREIAAGIATPADEARLLAAGSRLLADERASRSARLAYYDAFAGTPETIALEVAAAIALEQALWGPLAAEGMLGEPLDRAAFRATLDTSRGARAEALRTEKQAFWAHILSPFSNGLAGWAADLAASSEGRAFERAYRKARAGALLPRAYDLGRRLAERFGRRRG